jgi:hypothetical protein
MISSIPGIFFSSSFWAALKIAKVKPDDRVQQFSNRDLIYQRYKNLFDFG